MTCARTPAYEQLGLVQKPYQYVGHEENAYRKDFDTSRVRICLAFPDAYEIGMSNVGMQIIYHVINECDGIMADRAYAPLIDMGEMLARTGQRLKSKEAERPLSDFDCVGFTLQYELCYTNVLYMLDLGGIPRRAKDRRENDPLVMAGGPCVFNPEPMAEFFDFFVIGEGEDVTVEVVDSLERAKALKLNRAATLLALRDIKGIYIPSLYTPQYRDDGRFVESERDASTPKWVERRIIKDLDTVKYPTAPVTPAIKPVHERVSVEIQRGCTRSCRFCQAGYIYRPRRERNPNKVLEIIDASIRSTGITDIGLLSLSSADYSHVHPLMKKVLEKYKQDNLSVSLPSTRLEALKEEYLGVLKEQRRSGFTIAPEAGSQRLRNVINKNFTEDEVVETARMLFRNGWQSVKMYFMIGQPTETDEDVIAIAELGNTVIRRCSDIPGRKQVTISVSNFVPKPHTPFQWHEQISFDEIKRKQKLIRDHIQFKAQIVFKCHSADLSYAEGLVARGDRRAAAVIERAYDLGARFDCWDDRFRIELWQEAVKQIKDETSVDLDHEGKRGRGLEERLPWHRIFSGIHPKFFKNEYTKAIYGIATEDCSFSACHECGLCNDKSGVAPVILKEQVTVEDTVELRTGAFTDGSSAVSQEDPTHLEAVTYRFQYRKVEEGIYITILDLQNLLLRAFTRAGIFVVFDQGMRPRAKLNMGPALPLGVSSDCELFDITLKTSFEIKDLITSLQRFLPKHIELLTATTLDAHAPGITHIIKNQSFEVAMDEVLSGVSRQALTARIEELESLPHLLITRERKTSNGEIRRSVIDVKSCLEALKADGEHLRFTMSAPGGQSASPRVVLEALMGEEAIRDRIIPVRKTGFSTHTPKEYSFANLC